MDGLPRSTMPSQPAPAMANVYVAESDEGVKMVVLVIDHHSGRNVHYFPSESAYALASLLQTVAAKCRPLAIASQLPMKTHSGRPFDLAQGFAPPFGGDQAS